MQKVPQHLLQTQPIRSSDLGILGGNETGPIDIEVILHLGVLEEIGEHLFFVRPLLQQKIDSDIFGRKISDFRYQR